VATRHAWKTLEAVLKDLIHQIGFDKDTQNLLHQLLFVEPTWPFKMLLKPMIDRGNDPGSMPFGVGGIPNPFQQITTV
jgi:staphyloferrin B synthase